MKMYEICIPTFVHTLKALRAIVDKAAAHAEAKKFDPAVLVSARLFPDMLPFSRQIQIASDAAKGCAARLAGVEPPKFEDKETTLAELLARIDRTVDYLQSVTPESLDGPEDRPITVQTPRGPLSFSAASYVRHWALPNFFFHVTTAYALLRHNGVEVGKADFLGRPA